MPDRTEHYPHSGLGVGLGVTPHHMQPTERITYRIAVYFHKLGVLLIRLVQYSILHI